MKLFVSLLFLAGLVGCSSDKRTPYQKFDEDIGGYRDIDSQNDIHLTRFQGNYLTKRSYAETFARYHSLENCRHEGQAYSHILAVIDKTSTRVITRSNADYWGPSYYYGMGMSPYYSRYGGFGWSTGINMVNSRTWEETLTYPEYEVVYYCADRIYEPALAMRDIPPEEMSHLVKDLKGGIQVEKILPGSPNKQIKENDIILRAEGRRIMKGHQLLSLFKDGPRTVRVELLRDGVRKEVALKGTEVTSNVKENLSELKGKACDFTDVKKESSLCGERW